MNKLFFVMLSCSFLACSRQDPNPIIGSWRECLIDGNYLEYNIYKHYTTTSISDFQKHDFDEGISFYESHIVDSLLIVTRGINVDLMISPETVRFQFISHDQAVIEHLFGNSDLYRLKVDIPEIDSTKFDLWCKSYLEGFLERAELANCPDIRTEEEKAPPVDLGVIKDDFEELIELKGIPEWAALKLSKYKNTLERSYSLNPSHLEADFTGDGTLDIALQVISKSNQMKGILFLLGDNDSSLIVGCGNSSNSGTDNIEWVDFWEVIDKGITHETTFLENGDVDGSREVILKHSAISLREDEGSGGLIYYNGEEFVWIHQGD